jgi:hypothetical protein
MTVRTVISDAGAWRFAPDDPPPVADRSQAILQARVVDEVTGIPPTTALAVATSLAGAVARSSSGGRVGVVGRPRLSFPDISVALAKADLSIAAAGFLPLKVSSPMGPQGGYPDAFTAPDLGDLALRRAPSRLTGRVVSLALGPLSAASVRIVGVWPQQAAITGPASPPNGMPMLSGAYADRTGGATLRRRNFTAAVELKSLWKPAVAGDSTVVLSDRLAIGVGDVLAVEPGDPERVEFITLTGVDTTSSADQPARFTLAFPLRRDHAEGVSGVRAVPGPGGAANAVTRTIAAGDVTAWTAGLAGIGAATTAIEISGGAATEFHATAIYEASTGPAGDYRLPPIHRVAHVQLRVAHPSQPSPIIRAVTLEWGRTDVVADFVFP